MPIIVFAGYNAGTGGYGLAVVCANMIGLCFVLTWLPPELRQAVDRRHSARFQQPLHPTVLRPDHCVHCATKYILGEFGIGFALAVAVQAACFWMRRGSGPTSVAVLEARLLNTAP